MARPMHNSVTCPVCSQPFSAVLEQVLDTSVDPTVKERLLSGRVNLITCPHCGYQGMVGTPLMYHDHDKQLAIAYVPMELNLSTEERERIIGDLTNAVMGILPEEAPKGYLLQPGTALSLQGIIDQVLEADGITPEMVQGERRKVELINEFAEANSAQRDALIEENMELFDLGFMELLTAAAQAAGQSNDHRASLRLLNLREYLMENTEAGQELKAQQDALMEASQKLQALGESLTREGFVDLLVEAADDPLMVDAYGTLGRQLLDYTTFQLISDQINNSDGEQKEALTAVRERLLEINAEYEQQARAVIDRATDTLRMLLSAPDVPSAVRNNLNRIDDTFLQVLQVNLEQARQEGAEEVVSRLRIIRDEVLNLIQQSAPPEVQFINDLLSAESEADSVALLQERQRDVDENLLQVMVELAQQLREAGNNEAAARLEFLAETAADLVL